MAARSLGVTVGADDTSREPVYFEERYGSGGPLICYGAESRRRDAAFRPISHLHLQRFTTISQLFKAVFLPQGYPDSVSSDYLSYQLWDTFQAFVSSLTGTLATQAVLIGMGVGDSTATPIAATITWLLRDGTGMVGRIVFAWYQGSSLDCNSKQWRLFADAANDAALFLDLLAPHLTDVTLPLLCLSGVFKSLVGIAGGATRAAFVQHQAKRGNLADLAAKDGSQETVVNLVALVCSLALVPLVSGSNAVIWTLYVLFTAAHLFGNYKAIRALAMPTLNRHRLSILVNDYLKDPSRDMSVARVNASEPLVPGLGNGWKLDLGCSLSKLVNSVDELEKLLATFRGSLYFLNVHRKRGKILVSLHADSDAVTQLEACFHAEVARLCLRSEEFARQVLRGGSDAAGEGTVGDERLLTASRQFTLRRFPSFLTALRDNGWETGRSLVNPDEWRVVGFESSKVI